MVVSLRAFAVISTLALAALPAHILAMPPAAPLHEIAQSADLVFAGTVTSIDYTTSGTTPFTLVTFHQVERLHGTASASPPTSQPLTLRFAGGPRPDGTFLQVSSVPTITLGQRYVIFTSDHLANAASPIVASHNGLFRVIKDPATGREIIANHHGAVLTGISREGRPALGPIAESVRRNSNAAPRELPVVNQDIAVSDDGRQAIVSPPSRDTATSPALTMTQFRNLLQQSLLQQPVTNPSLKSPDSPPGKFIRVNKNGQQEALDLLTTSPVADHQPIAPSPTDAANTSPRGQALVYCGTQALPIVFEQFPRDSWVWDVGNHSMVQYNQFMGPVGSNSAKPFFQYRDSVAA